MSWVGVLGFLWKLVGGFGVGLNLENLVLVRGMEDWVKNFLIPDFGLGVCYHYVM